MMIGINTSPLAGLDGKLLTARQVRNRLDQELVGNVSLRVLDGDRPDAWEVQGRGELQLAMLVEQMRREGFELTIGKPQVVTRRIDGVLSEPVERLAIDVPEAYSGVVIGLLALRKGKMEQMVNHGTGWVRLDYLVPARGLIGFRTEFITETRGTGILHHVFEGFAPWFGELKTRPNGSLVADRRGVSTSHALMSLQERGELFIGPAVDVYEGMVIGVNARPEDLDVNAAKEKKASNMRSAHAEELVRLAPPRHLSLEQALEFIREDEAVEVTPTHVRLRKVVLPAGGRTKTARREPRRARRRDRLSRIGPCPNRARRKPLPVSSCRCTMGLAPFVLVDEQHERVARGVARERPVGVAPRPRDRRRRGARPAASRRRVVGEDDLEAAQRGRAGLRRAGAAAAPGVRADVMVIAAGREERGLAAVLRHQAEAEDVAVELDRWPGSARPAGARGPSSCRRLAARTAPPDRPARPGGPRDRAGRCPCARPPGPPRASADGRRRSRCRVDRDR